MLRCVTLVCALIAAAAPATAQVPRNFPATALRGEIVVTQPPEMLLNRLPARLAPGARIRGMDNMLQMSGALVGQRLLVHYTLDTQGGVLDVWVLTPAEIARRPWPTTPQQASSWLFDPAAQSWSPP
jgi:hypothetical protein